MTAVYGNPSAHQACDLRGRVSMFLVAALLAAALTTTIVLWLRREEELVPARWIEDDDGVQPADPRTVGLAGAA